MPTMSGQKLPVIKLAKQTIVKSPPPSAKKSSNIVVFSLGIRILPPALPWRYRLRL